MKTWMRKLHRFLSMAFVVTVLMNFGAMAMGSQAVWVGFLALVPLIPLLITGIYLFILPYTAKGRSSAQSA